jgi:prepilin signal peptidase PulO-like enzyme (type II secretory pathway)
VTCRRGIVKAIQYLVVSMFRYPFWRLIVIVMFVGSGLISLVWLWGGAHWQSLLTALVGMAFGGGLIWAIRIVGGSALGKEAMGFGDVTLMAMIGVYVGWQPSLLIFFMAPFVAVAICLVQWIVTQRRDIAFGPYLCVSALLLIVYWDDMWHQRARPIFYLGWLVPQILFFCLILMAGMLWLWRLIERAIFGNDRQSTSDD